MSKEKLIEVKQLKKYFNVGHRQTLKAVDNVTFSIYKGETLGVVGESGCGKTTLGRTLTVIYKKTEGEILFKGENLDKYSKKEISKHFQIIFQDPDASLNPRMTVGEIIAEGLDIHHLCATRQEREERIYELLEQVGLSREQSNRFPHEFSGGQKQRIGIARALAIEPEFIVCDEPISALDVSIQAQVVNLLQKIQKEKGLTLLFIAHDLSMVKYISDRVAVMYLGDMVEIASSKSIYQEAKHPYTLSLLSAIPDIKSVNEEKKLGCAIQGELPDPISPPPGCKFNTRCPHAFERCFKENPMLKEVETEHFVACHLFENDSN